MKKDNLKIFKKSSIGNLKKLYKNSVNYLFDKDTWRSTANDTYGELRVLLHTRKSLIKLGNELNIFKAPSIVGLQISYNKSLAFIFDSHFRENHLATISEDNFLLRDLSNSAINNDTAENELKIFKYLNIDYLESMYRKK